MNKLALAMIVTPTDNEAKLLDRCLSVVAPFVDGIFITITGKNKECEKVCKKYNAVISYFDWIGDFSAARNFNFAQVTDDYEFTLWLDADDIIDKPEKIKEVLDLADPKVDGVIVNYAYQLDKYGRSLADHWRMRIKRKGSDFKWLGRIHEDLLSDSYSAVAKTPDFQVLHLSKPGRRDDNIKRNLDILLDEISKQGNEPDPRLLYYLGLTLIDTGDKNQSIEVFKRFIKLSGWDEQRWDAWIRIAHLCIDLEDYKQAEISCFEAMKERPDYPDPYFIMGKICHSQELWNKTVDWIKIGFTKPKPSTTLVINPRNYDVIPLTYLSEALFNLGRIDEAIETLQKVEKIYPDSDIIGQSLGLYKAIKEQKDASISFVNYCKYLRNIDEDKEIIPKLLEYLPQDLQDNPLIIKVKNEYLPIKKWEDNEITIMCGGASWEEWTPDSIKTGIGGSEEAVIYLSKELTKLGWKVTVYASPGIKAGEYEGVIYKNFWEANLDDDFNILISWRQPHLFDHEFKANKKYLWLHDVMNKRDMSSKGLKQVDKIIVLSKFHRDLFPYIPDDKFWISSNGIVLDQFKGEEKRKPHSLIYGSCPSRGLEILLDIWPEVRKEVPDVTLDIYYGWFNFIKGNKDNASKMKWMEQMQEKIKQEGITFHGRIGQEELAREYMKSDIWSYSCQFPEISCITAMKAQAAGTIPVILNYAALNESVAHGYREELPEKYKDMLINALKDKNREKLRKPMQEWANKFSWKEVAKQWNDEFKK